MKPTGTGSGKIGQGKSGRGKYRPKHPWLFAVAAVPVLACVVRYATVPARPHGAAARKVWMQDAYVWQRQWTPAVARAIDDSAAGVHAWHVLAAELDRTGQWRDSRVEAGPLPLSGRPVIAVFRMDGQLADADADVLARHVATRVDAWARQGWQVAGVEIDHDCATSRLADYGRFLDRLRQAMGGRHALWITALPTWMDAPVLPDVLSRADEVVLQVHAVQDPRLGLFNAARAMRWMAQFARLSPRPWHVALPAYGSRVIWGADGGISAVESETPAMMGDAPGHDELVADPADVARFMTTAEDAPPRGFAGWVWFRLPTGDDRRAWSPGTWRAVMAHRPLTYAMRTRALRDAPGLYDIVVENTGDIDAVPPGMIRVDGACRGAGGRGGYGLEYDARGPWLRRRERMLLAPGVPLLAGWARCDGQEPDVHAAP